MSRRESPGVGRQTSSVVLAHVCEQCRTTRKELPMEGKVEAAPGRRPACERCGRLARELSYDEISQKNLCPACLSSLQAQRLKRL